MWLRNPQFFIREALAAHVLNWAWDIGYMLKKNVDVNRFADLYAPAAQWRQLVIGNASQGAIELRPGNTLAKPHAIHPVWEYGGAFRTLEKLVESGEHERIVLTQLPRMSLVIAKDFMAKAADLQAEHEEVKLHPHGLYTYAKTFGLDFGATDVEPRADAAKGKIILPTGKIIRWEQATDALPWIKILNTNPLDLSEPAERCKYNIKSAVWAGKHFNEIERFKHTFDKEQVVDDAAVDDPPLPEAQNILLKKN